MGKINWDDEFYSIYEDNNGKKCITLKGYYYCTDGGYDEDGEWNEDYCAREVTYLVEYELEDFINRFINGDEDWVESEEYDCRKEHSMDMMEDEALDIMKNNKSIHLHFSHLTMDVSCGDYVDCD